ncbi:MAG TPA: type VI secretion system tip protein TssI/VgrG [Polyangiaceae bacterium]|jgi:type VI secretion system secreted protein VgrG
MEEEDRFELEGAKLPTDAVAVAYECREGVSRCYRLDVEFATREADFDAESCLKSQVSLLLRRGGGTKRIIDAVVQEVSFRRVVGDRLYFAVRAGPALEALAHRRGSRIFQNQSVVDVVCTLCDEAGFLSNVQKQFERAYEPKPFIVQYRESQLDFVNRLLESAGIFYFFEHDEQGHRLILADSPKAFRAQGSEAVLSLASSGAAGTDPVLRLTRRRMLATSSVELRDFDFEKPGAPPVAAQSADDGWDAPYYEYPAGFVKPDEGQNLANARLSELRAGSDTCCGETLSLELRCAAPFTIENAGDEALNGRFVVTEMVSRGDELSEQIEQRRGQSVTFRAIPAGSNYAPPRRTPRPRIAGIQTAVVTGAETSDQAIHTDPFGRIKVRFYWDRIGQQDDQSSCWLRVSQIPLGGSMILPRVGWEVSVAFLEGDPDRPLVLGRLYDGVNAPPMALPGASASGALRSQSSPGGAGMNEISFGDSGGGQGFGISAQKDLNITCGNDSEEKVGVDDAHRVGVNLTRSVKVNETVKIGGDHTLSVGENLSAKIKSSQTVVITGNDVTNATGNFLEKESSRTYLVGGNQLTISNGIELSSTGPLTRTVGAVEVRASASSLSDNVLAVNNSTVGAVRMHLVNGSHGEVIGGPKSQMLAAAEVHVTSGSYVCDTGAAHQNLVGGLHWRKITGDFVVKAPMITLMGGLGKFEAGGSSLALSGGPITMQGSKIVIKAALIKKTSGTMAKG